MLRPILRRAILSIVVGFSLWALLLLVFLANNSADLDASTRSLLNRNCSIGGEFKPITCFIDGAQRVACARRDNEVYLPFSKYLKRQFDVSGHFGKNHFEYFTSFAKMRIFERDAYHPSDPFDQFSSVALRQRVKCVCAVSSLPMSTQWAPEPYLYPVQILQYGLEQYNKNRTAPQPVVVKSLEMQLDAQQKADDLFQLGEAESVELRLHSDLPMLLFSMRTQSAQSGFALRVRQQHSARLVELHFVHSHKTGCVWRNDSAAAGGALSFVYSLGPWRNESAAEKWVHFVLDIPVYATKALAVMCGEKHEQGAATECTELGSTVFTPVALVIRGRSELRAESIRQQSSAHSELFHKVAKWVLDAQDAGGGWPVPVARPFAEPQLQLGAGWHSAMAQGHALSFLRRAYAVEPDQRYIVAAQKALALFNVSAAEGGVRNTLFGQPWFEEYPTTPGTFVLNGFIYSLLGLYDFGSLDNRSRALFEQGLHSLRVLLPLFDTGQRSVYDLRHLALGTRPNVARWDYHAVHIYQLGWMHAIAGEKLFARFAQRWMDYAHGMALKHN